MTYDITIPATAEEVDASIASAMDVLAYGEWPLAAWLASCVRLAPGRGKKHPEVNPTTGISTPAQFAAKGIRGLTKDMTITRYVKAWLDQNDGQYPALGSTVEMPDVTFPGNSKTEDTTPGVQKVKDVKANANAVRTALADPVYAAKVIADMPDEVRSEIATQALAGLTEEKRDDAILASVPQTPASKDRARQRKEDDAAAGDTPFQEEARLITKIDAFMTLHPSRAQALADHVAIKAMEVLNGLAETTVES